MRSTISIAIDAPPEHVFGLAREVERWPAMLPHYVAVRVFDRRADGSLLARFVARRQVLSTLGLGFPVAWRARCWNDAATLQLRFRHVGGATAGMDVTWRIEPDGCGCRVTIEHVFTPRIRPWSTFVDRVFVRPVAGQTLATFKAIAEALAGSADGRSTNRSL
jgi:ribosome-associated toxin RatA of RatAB toxin-antitoxin module